MWVLTLFWGGRSIFWVFYENELLAKLDQLFLIGSILFSFWSISTLNVSAKNYNVFFKIQLLLFFIAKIGKVRINEKQEYAFSSNLEQVFTWNNDRAYAQKCTHIMSCDYSFNYVSNYVSIKIVDNKNFIQI